MEIVCSTDNNYVMPTGVMICSLCENNHDEQIRFHILSSDITDANKASLERITSGYGQRIEFHKINDADLADFPIGREGQNARLAAKLTGFKIDIKGDRSLRGDEQTAGAGAEDAAE